MCIVNVKIEGVIGIEQVYLCESDDKQQFDFQLNPFENAILKEFELHNVHTKGAETEKCSTLYKDIVE